MKEEVTFPEAVEDLVSRRRKTSKLFDVKVLNWLYTVLNIYLSVYTSDLRTLSSKTMLMDRTILLYIHKLKDGHSHCHNHQKLQTLCFTYSSVSHWSVDAHTERDIVFDVYLLLTWKSNQCNCRAWLCPSSLHAPPLPIPILWMSFRVILLIYSHLCSLWYA